MSAVSGTMRAAVEQRAGYRCEYCHIPTKGQVATFEIDHLHPISAGGPTILANLALACPRCNGSKWKFEQGQDAETGQAHRLYNPRTDEWTDHFEWSRDELGVLSGKTPEGRATIARLQMNHPELIELRVILVEVGLFPELLQSGNDNGAGGT